MAQEFTRNYTDLSNDSGYQFEFRCDKCGNGHRSTFATNKLGLAAGVLWTAGNIFGGGLRQAGYGADSLKHALRGTAWDSALAEAVEEIRPKFQHCRCGKWVCQEACWNQARGVCEECAPDQPGAGAGAASCPNCQASVQAGAKFCSECGGKIVTPKATRTFCSECGAKLQPGVKFCAECGTSAAT